MITLRQPGAIHCTLALPRQGPCKVVQHHENGSIKLELELNYVERVNICRSYPYYLLQKDDIDHDVNTQPINIPTVFV